MSDFFANVRKVLGEADTAILVPDLAKLLGDLPDACLNKLTLGVEMEAAGMSTVGYVVVPYRKRAMYGVEFPKVVRSVVQTTSNGKEVTQTNYWPAVMLKDAKMDEAATARRKLATAIEALPECKGFTVKVRGADICIVATVETPE